MKSASSRSMMQNQQVPGNWGVFLQDPTDWPDWDYIFKAWVIEAELTEVVFENMPPIPEPTRPKAYDYASANTRAVIEKATAAATAAPATTGREIPGSSAGGPSRPSDPRDRYSNQIVLPYMEDEERESLMVAFELYKIEMLYWELQREKIQRVRQKLLNSVSLSLQRSCCEPLESLTTWYQLLHKAVGPDTYR